MKKLTALTILLTFVIFQGFGQKIKADMVLINAKVHTLDTQKSNAEAIAIAGNKVLAVGSNKEILS